MPGPDSDGNAADISSGVVVHNETIHVGDPDRSSTSQKNTWTAAVTITVHDGAHAAVADANVTGAWSDGASGSSFCTTASTGQCTVTKGGLPQRRGSVTFTVTSVTHDTFTYEPAANHDPDSDSDGSHISVPKR